MSRKLLMKMSAIVLGVMGIILIFMPKEILQMFSQTPNEGLALIIQLMGALYFGFAILNWMAKNVLIGGIYAKPLSLGNFINFFIGGLTLIKAVISGDITIIYVWILTALYLFFAVAFGIVSFTSPKQKTKE